MRRRTLKHIEPRKRCDNCQNYDKFLDRCRFGKSVNDEGLSLGGCDGWARGKENEP